MKEDAFVAHIMVHNTHGKEDIERASLTTAVEALVNGAPTLSF